MNIRLLIALVLNSLLLSTAVIAQDISVGTTTLGSYETRFHYAGDDVIRNRAYNVRKAIRKLDGTILRPQETLSYNRLLGQRTGERGWRQAKTILHGEIFIDYGGGICQVSSTLHAAAIYSGMDIVQAQHHSRYMTYIDPGLDATVNWTAPPRRATYLTTTYLPKQTKRLQNTGLLEQTIVALKTILRTPTKRCYSMTIKKL